MNDSNSGPCLIETGQGVSLEYRGRRLYSTYAPEKSILRTVRQTELLPGTLVLCFSPCLGYGLDALAEKLPRQSLMLGCEADAALFSVAEKYTSRLECAKSGKFKLLRPEELRLLPLILNSRKYDGTSLPPRGTFRRALRIDFSAGASFNSTLYARLDKAVENAIAQFWKNRITLIKFGRRFSGNVMRNLAQLPNSRPFCEFSKTVRTPIFVLGAGESLEAALDFLERQKDGGGRVSGAYILAADAALSALKRRNIFADGIVCEECQRAIATSFIGCQNSAGTAFASLSSCPDTAVLAAQACCFYATRFDDAAFLEDIESRIPLSNPLPPLGSVGVSAVKIAAQLRKDDSVPIYVSGLDFSYSVGKTHADGTAHARTALIEQNRLHPHGAYAAAFGTGARRTEQGAVTTVALSGYADVFKEFFSESENIFYIRNGGLPLGIPKKSEKEAADSIFHARKKAEAVQGIPTAAILQRSAERTAWKQAKIKNLSDFFMEERAALRTLKEILGGTRPMEGPERRLLILRLLERRDYLYLHFPDGFRLSLEKGFLNRVSAEAGFFLKVIETSLCRLEEQQPCGNSIVPVFL